MKKKSIFEIPEAIIVAFASEEIIVTPNGSSGEGPDPEDPDNQWQI